LDVRRISARDTLPLRHKLLREGKDLETCKYEGDEDDQTFHLGAFIDSKLVSVASLYFERHPSFEDPYQYRLRGMATMPEHRRTGLSSALLQMAFPIVKQNQCTLLWCNARTSAIGYYEKSGFEIVGEEFDIPEIGPHYLMVKYI
jgi:GNAT superfamily N-acetyltransferase